MLLEDVKLTRVLDPGTGAIFDEQHINLHPLRTIAGPIFAAQRSYRIPNTSNGKELHANYPWMTSYRENQIKTSLQEAYDLHPTHTVDEILLLASAFFLSLTMISARLAKQNPADLSL